jgi:hypothetical protein
MLGACKAARAWGSACVGGHARNQRLPQGGTASAALGPVKHSLNTMLHIEFPTFFRTLCTFVPPQVIYDPQSHVKALFAWSGDTVVVSFRGSAAPLNWLMDALVGGVVGGPPNRARGRRWGGGGGGGLGGGSGPGFRTGANRANVNLPFAIANGRLQMEGISGSLLRVRALRTRREPCHAMAPAGCRRCGASRRPPRALRPRPPVPRSPRLRAARRRGCGRRPRCTAASCAAGGRGRAWTGRRGRMLWGLAGLGQGGAFGGA